MLVAHKFLAIITMTAFHIPDNPISYCSGVIDTIVAFRGPTEKDLIGSPAVVGDGKMVGMQCNADRSFEIYSPTQYEENVR